MSKKLVTPEKSAAAVNELLSYTEVATYLQELSLMHSAFVQSDLADCQRTRVHVNGSYERLRDFLLELSAKKSKE